MADGKASAEAADEVAKQDQPAAAPVEDLEKARAAWQAERDELTAKLEAATQAKAAAETEALRLRVLTSAGVPENLARYVTGATQEELEASAKQVLADFTPPAAAASDVQAEPEPKPPLGPRPDTTQGGGSDVPLNGDELTNALMAALGIATN